MLRKLLVAFGATLMLPAAALAADGPTVLPAVGRTLSSATTSSRACTATNASSGRGLAATVYTAPISGFLSTKLRGAGDWDLTVRDATTGRLLSSSLGFGGSEVAQNWVDGGQKLLVTGCRHAGAGRSAAVGMSLVDAKPPTGQNAPISVQRVKGDPRKLDKLEDLGFDVTESRGPGFADVIVNGAAQLAQLKKSGLSFTTHFANLTASDRAARAADAAATQPSDLPSGRTEYRDLDAIQQELKDVAAANPGLVRPITLGTSFQGRPIQGLEIAKDVNGDDGRPYFLLVALHHAREWPSAEAAMEYIEMLVKKQDDPRYAALLSHERTVVVPVVNPDGYVESRGSAPYDPADNTQPAADQLPDSSNPVTGPTTPGGTLDLTGAGTLAEGVLPPGGSLAYRRKNCDGAIPDGDVPCDLQYGVDNNRNYGFGWGGAGGSPDPTSQSFHGPSPRSEPETQAVFKFTATHQVTALITLHTVAALVLRPPGLHDGGLAPDEDALKDLGDKMGAATGYTSEFGYQLYDTAGTTEDDTYGTQGGFGYTIEMGPENGPFHGAYQSNVVDQWDGTYGKQRGNPNAGGLAEALTLAAEAAATPGDHATLEGHAPAGRVLHLHKAFDTKTSAYCPLGPDPVLDVAGILGTSNPCPDPQPPLAIKDALDSKITVPASGTFSWSVNPSTRPFVGKGTTVTKDVPVGKDESFTGTTGSTGDTHDFTIDPADAVGKVDVHLTADLPEDYDITVSYKDGDTYKQVGTSGNSPGEDEDVTLVNPAAGSYRVTVAYFTAVTGQYELTVKRSKTVTAEGTPGQKEAYLLTCEDSAGKVLEEHSVVIDRSKAMDLDLGCGAAPSTATGDGGQVYYLGGGDESTPVPDASSAVDGTPVTFTGSSVPAKKATKKPLTAKQKAALKKAAAKKKTACQAKAKKLKSASKRKAALKRC